MGVRESAYSHKLEKTPKGRLFRICFGGISSLPGLKSGVARVIFKIRVEKGINEKRRRKGVFHIWRFRADLAHEVFIF